MTATPEPLFCFAIPLRRPKSVADRKRLDGMLGLGLKSIYQQTDGNFRVFVAAAHRPELPDFVDERLEIVSVPGFVGTDWLSANQEGGVRVWTIAQRFAALGGGYFMPLDHDDLVHRDLVKFVRADRHRSGYAMAKGYIYDATANALGPYPIPNVPMGEFHRFCGSSLVLHFSTDDIQKQDASGLSLFARVMSRGHPVVLEKMEEEGRPLALLPFEGVAYVRNIGDNLSRVHEDADRRDWLRWLDAAVLANAVSDPAIRAAFAIPERYPFLLRPPATARSAPAPSLSVLVCTHRRPKGLERLLAALVPQVEKSPEREIVVVNDGTHDAAYGTVANKYAGKIRYIALEKNVGVAAARNETARLARNDYLVFTDDDCEPPSYWLDWLAGRLAQHPNLDVVAGMTKAPPGAKSFLARVRDVHQLFPLAVRASGTVLFSTANVAIRRSLFMDAGGFGFPGFTGAGEDTELAGRLGLRGAAGVCDPSWVTWHDASEGLVDLMRRYWRYGYANGRLMRLTTSPIVHDFKLFRAREKLLSLWRSEFRQQLSRARAVHESRIKARLSALVASFVQLAYWRGIKAALGADV